jgi:hypothetical protein
LKHRPTFPHHPKEFQTGHWLALANLWNHHLSKYWFRLYQINNYSFADTEFISECLDRLASLRISSENSIFEDAFAVSSLPEFPNVMLQCSIDCVDQNRNCVYEFKCVDKITIDHILQVAIYMYADHFRDSISTTDPNPKTSKQWFIFNMRANELIEVRFDSFAELRSVMKALHDDRFVQNNNKHHSSDREFSERCRNI